MVAVVKRDGDVDLLFRSFNGVEDGESIEGDERCRFLMTRSL